MLAIYGRIYNRNYFVEKLLLLLLLVSSVVDGTSVVMKFRYLYELEKYLQVAYLEYRERQQAYFQLQFVEVNVGSNKKVDIYSQYVRK